MIIISHLNSKGSMKILKVIRPAISFSKGRASLALIASKVISKSHVHHFPFLWFDWKLNEFTSSAKLRLIRFIWREFLKFYYFINVISSEKNSSDLLNQRNLNNIQILNDQTSQNLILWFLIYNPRTNQRFFFSYFFLIGLGKYLLHTLTTRHSIYFLKFGFFINIFIFSWIVFTLLKFYRIHIFFFPS